MSNEAQGLVRNLAMPAPHKPILMAYANYADESGYCWPGVETIAFDTGFSEPTVKRARRELIADGWMGTKRRFGTSAATRLNLPQIAAAAVDRGDRTRLNHDIEFGGVPAGQRLSDQSDPNGKPQRVRRSKSAGRGLSDQSDPNGTRSDQSDPNEGIRVIPTRDQSDPLSLTDPSEDPSVEGVSEGRTSLRSIKPEPEPAEWALRLVTDLDYGRHRRPTHTQAAELAELVAAARDEHGLSEPEIRRHCRATLNEATRSGVAYLRGGLAADRLPVPTTGARRPGPTAPTSGENQQGTNAGASDLTAADLLARGLRPELLPSRLKEAAQR